MVCFQHSPLWFESDSPATRTEELSDWLCLSEDKPLEYGCLLIAAYVYEVTARYELNVLR